MTMTKAATTHPVHLGRQATPETLASLDRSLERFHPRS
jgi:hypothetical protein